MLSLSSTCVVLGTLIVRVVGMNGIKDVRSLHTSFGVSKRNRLHEKRSILVWINSNQGAMKTWHNGVGAIEVNKLQDATSLDISIDVSTTSKRGMECLVMD